jgi:16S rRNA (cytosine967-C5)-methyltransferase
MVKENISRLGLSDCVTAIEYHSLDEYFKKQGGFDCVLVDAPCSNTGVLARRPEVRHRITEKAVEDLTRIQADLLCEAAEMLKSQGVLCYSTCSIQPAENGLLVKRFLQENPGFTLREEKLILPSAKQPDHDGSYTAIMEKGSGVFSVGSL